MQKHSDRSVDEKCYSVDTCSAALASLVLVLAAMICGCTNPDHAAANLPVDALFRLHCSPCHGDGSGNGHIAPTLTDKPRNLKHSSWQTSATDEHIKKVIKDGGLAVKLSKEMPGFRDKLTDQEIRQLVSYIRRLGMR